MYGQKSTKQFRKMFVKERKEHPSFTNKQIVRIVKDHMKKK